ncbi:RluA family pseudouridine synthase [Roseicitreum antarcticum]|uniref:Pseudouridine synthase n=1 Tax=Roseicitreum antarcticum TaxID=564137 RepID=A0A1H2Y080_9RHOB|nr:RluA family pseudouridine synthase [Roseicitreum antarcticum]SDW98451.1 ribosomal large subunit pseudouridine synthase D [Roseicitreum antarcticum]
MSDLHSVVQVVIGPNPPDRLDKALARDVPEGAALSRSRLMRLIADGAVRRGAEVLDQPRARVAEGEVIEIAVTHGAEVDTVAQDIALDVVWEDDDLIVINKPAGMVVHPAPGSPDQTLVNALLHHCGDTLSGVGGERRPGIVHRIDKETSGLLVVAKTDRAHHGLAAQFEAHSTARRYLTVVYGAPDAADPRLHGVRGTNFEAGNILKITTQLARHRTDRQRQAVTFTGGRHAVTRARVLEAFGTPPSVALVECWLETGRTHQIRVHMAHVGHALIGDPVYGGRRKLSEKTLGAGVQACADFPRQALHAATLGFKHPVTGGDLSFSAEIPQDMQRLIADLRG